MRDRLLALIAGPLPSADQVEHAALSLWAWQREHLPAYGRFCGTTSPSRIQEIPAVPVSLFRDVAMRHPKAFEVFRTSGTTSGRRGEHWLVDTALYDLGARRWFEHCLPDCPTAETVSLVPDPAQLSDSSLGHMIRHLAPTARWHSQH